MGIANGPAVKVLSNSPLALISVERACATCFASVSKSLWLAWEQEKGAGPGLGKLASQNCYCGYPRHTMHPRGAT